MEPLIFPAILFIVMYFLLIRPQQRRQREATDLAASLAVGDEVVLNSGIHGFINGVDNGVIWLEVSPGTELKVSRSAVGHKVTDDDESVDGGDDDDDDALTDDDLID